jgi:FkbM family methyltransferase
MGLRDKKMNKERALRIGQWLTRLRPLELAVLMKKLLRVQRLETEAQGIKLWVDPASNFGIRILREGNYEAGLSAAFAELLKPGDTFVDVGANEGWFSLLAAKLVGPSGRVLACEPQERLWPVIAKNIALNRLSNITLLPFACSDCAGQQTMHLYPSLNSGSSHMGGAARRWEKTQTVEALPLSDILDGLGGRSVDLLKIDVEGFEHKVLLGAGEYLGTKICALVVETHAAQLGKLGTNEQQITALLASKGYALRRAGDAEVWELLEAGN